MEMTRLNRSAGRLVIASLCWCGWGSTARAQEQQQFELDDGGFGPVAGRDVYLNDSFEATDALHEATKLARNENWAKAAELLQQTADRFGGRLVRVSEGLYVGIRQHINGVISGWPAEGLGAYRSLYEQQAEAGIAAVRSQRDVHELLALADRYYCTRVVGRMIDTIGQLAIESGDLGLARHLYRRALDLHPDAQAHAAQWRATIILIEAMRGDDPEDRRALVQDTPIDERDDYAELETSQKIRWMGKDRALKDVVTEVREGFGAVREPVSPLEWPIFGGNAERNRSCSTNVDELGLLWRFPFVARSEMESDSGGFGSRITSTDDGARALIVQPVVSGGLILLQRHRTIVAVHRNTGEMAWRYHPDEDTDQRIDFLEDRAPGWDAVTVHEGRVYASLPGDAIPYFSYGSSRLPHELICLELGTGRPIWRVDQHAFEDRFAEVHFDSTPIVRNGRLYILGRRRRSFGFEDCYLYRFSAADGALEHRTHLGSASTGSFGSRPATKAVAAMHADTLYVCTNLGTIAAIYAHTGAVRWLRLYERTHETPGDTGGRFTSELDPWRFNPVIWSRGRVIALPTDSAGVLVLSAHDGRILRSIPLDRFGKIEALLGARGDLICGAGLEVACYDLAADRLRWSQPLAQDGGVFGRGIWVDDLLLVSTPQRLSTFAVSDGRRGQIDLVGPASAPVVSDPCNGGNLLATPNQLLVAGGDALCSFVRKTQILGVLRRRMAAAPRDPLPALELAEVTLRAGEEVEALVALDEADRRVVAGGESIDQSLHERFFKDILTFAMVLGGRSTPATPVLDKLLTLASRYAPDEAGHLQYRLRFAKLFRRHKQPDRALSLYHQILRDRSLRELPVDPESASSSRASVLARDRIADLVNDHGRKIYEPYEAEARRWLSGARASADEEILGQIVEQYPNSRAAPLALTVHAELLAKSGRTHQAVRRWTKVYQRYPKEVDRATLLRRIADAYESAGNREQAYRWLTKAAREHPGVLIEHRGRKVSFLEYRGRLTEVRDRVEPGRPRLSPPLGPVLSRTFNGPAALLAPEFGDNPAHRWTTCYVYTPDGIHAIDPRTGADRWRVPAKVRMAAELLINLSDIAVFATPFELIALDTETGKRRWSQGHYPPHLDDHQADWEDAATFRTHALKGDRLISARGDGQISCVSLRTGEPLWSATHSPVPWGKLAPADSWIAYYAVRQGRALLCRIDLATGTWLDAILTDQTRPVDDLLVTLDEQLILVTSQSITSYDVESRAIRWHTPISGHLRRASLLLDVEAIYFSPAGRELAKVAVQDGRQLWLTEDLIQHGDGDLLVRRQGDNLLVTTQSSVAAVDPVTGLLLWRGTTPPRPRFVSRLITQRYVVAVDLPGEIHEGANTAYFFDHRNASGLIPKGGAPDLGLLEDVRTILAADGALLIQTGSTIRCWTNE